MKPPSGTAPSAAGFTAVELAAVLAVTVIIGALGLSAYRTYVVRAQIASAIADTAGVRDRVAAVFRATGIPPANRQALGLDPKPDGAWGEYIGTIDVARGRVEVRFGAAADEAIAGRSLSMTPFETADQRVVWLCGNKLPGPDLKPLGFAGGAPQPVQVLTLIDGRYLPPSCR